MPMTNWFIPSRFWTLGIAGALDVEATLDDVFDVLFDVE